MIDLLFVPVAILYFSLISLLFIYGINFFYLSFVTLGSHKNRQPSPTLQALPVVTVQLPIYNELYVSERLIEAASRLDYPAHLLEIQVLDDSTDETSEIVRKKVDFLQSQGVNIKHLHRAHRAGFKAGALAEGLARARGDFLAIFDADFVPPPDFLRKTIPYFQDDEIAFVQTRWGHLNRDFSLFTLLQSLAIDSHFMVEQFGRSQAGFWFNFNGTAGVWRRKAIEAAGGWKADTLTEDLDLSYRAFLSGWRAVYLRDVEVQAELPVSFTAFRRQQHRWARGSLECSQRLLPQVWNQPVPLSYKVIATLHLSGYFVHLLLFSLLLMYPLILFFSIQQPRLTSLFGIAAMMNGTALAPTFLFIVSQQQSGRKWWRLLPAILFTTVLGHGMMLNTARAALQILLARQSIFERTPKFGILDKRQNWSRHRYQLKLDPLVFVEAAFALLALATSAFAISLHSWGIAFYSAVFCLGLLFTSSLTIKQAIHVLQHPRKAPAQPGSNPAYLPAAPYAKPAGFPPENPSVEATVEMEANLPAVRSAVLPSSFALELAILKTLAYADVFDYPLTSSEVHRYLIGMPASFEQVEAALEKASCHKSSSNKRHGSLLVGRAIHRRGYFMLANREAIGETRQVRQAVSYAAWPKAIAYGRQVARLPYVRMVALTGALAVDNQQAGGDFDYLVVTEAGRLWLCRAMVILLVRRTSLDGVVICPNYFLSESALCIYPQTLYTARELVQMVPISGLDIYSRLRTLNDWTRGFLPNAFGKPDLSSQPPLNGAATHQNSLKSMGEEILRSSLGSWLERWEMERKIRKFTALPVANLEPDDRLPVAEKYELPEVDFCADWCKGHFSGHGHHTLAAYQARLESLGVPVY